MRITDYSRKQKNMPPTTSFFDIPLPAHPAVPIMALNAQMFLFPPAPQSKWMTGADARISNFQRRLTNLLDAEAQHHCNLVACLPDVYLRHMGENLEEIRKYRLGWPANMQDEFTELNEIAITAMADQLLK